MEPGATVMTELSGGNAGRLSVSGRVELNNATLSVAGAPRPGGTSTFTLIDNDGSDAVAGIFSGAPERAMVTTDGRPMRISYVGGDGNDVTLQVPGGTVIMIK